MNENKKRFLLEKFLDYKLLRNTGLNDDKNASNNLALKKLQNINDTNKFMKILNLGKINEEKIEFKNEEENTVNNYLISLLKDENKLDNEKYKYISDFINNSSDNINLVVNILLNQCKKGSFISIVNIDNLY